MDDMIALKPDFEELFGIAAGQHGHFTTAQAKASGFSDSLLSYHVQTGRFQRIYRGVYRFRDYPTFPNDGIAAVWLAVGRDISVVSHESALDLLELSDVIPYAVHVTVPRTKRRSPRIPGVRIHTTTHSLEKSETLVREGIRITNVPRTIVDAAEYGTGPEQIEMAIHQSIRQGLTTPARLTQAAKDRPHRVRQLVRQTLNEISW
jgi:predicted transcriptional regulator of viral defense system